MSTQTLATLRIGIGLAQGIVLYLLYQAYDTKVRPATEGVLFGSVLPVAIFAPIVAMAGLGNLRPRTLAAWALAVVVVCTGGGGYEVFRDPLISTGTTTPVPRNLPSAVFWLAATAILFIANAMIIASDAERRLIASYSGYFDASWKSGVQFTLAALFTVLLWGLLWLGSELFKLITLDFLASWMKRPWFSIPVTLMAFACAIHVTDVRANLVTGARTLKLTLEAWLLPVMTVFAGVFLAALPVIGVEPLWATRNATSILLGSAAALIFLINAAYQDGRTAVASVLQYARLVAAVLIVPLVALGGYALMLRVQQYGWTPQRVFAFTCFCVASCYAIGYAVAAIRSRLALRGLETTNVFTAFVIVVALIALFSPIADPARISVADQVDRVLTGRVAPEQFDAQFLRFSAGRYGTAALQRLVEDAAAPASVVEQAKKAQAAQSRWSSASPPPFRASFESRTRNIRLNHASIAALPSDFMHEDWVTRPHPLHWPMPGCLIADTRCEALLVDLNGDGTDEIVLFGIAPTASTVFAKRDGKWTVLGILSNGNCAGVSNALRQQRFVLIAPTLKEIDVDGVRMRFVAGELNCARTPR